MLLHQQHYNATITNRPGSEMQLLYTLCRLSSVHLRVEIPFSLYSVTLSWSEYIRRLKSCLVLSTVYRLKHNRHQTMVYSSKVLKASFQQLSENHSSINNMKKMQISSCAKLQVGHSSIGLILTGI